MKKNSKDNIRIANVGYTKEFIDLCKINVANRIVKRYIYE